MSNLHVKYMLIGAGVAGSSAAQAIRQRDPEGSILMVGREINRPYHRPPLSKAYLRREMPRAELFTLPAEWFEIHHVQLRTGVRAAHLDVARRAVTLASGEEVSFDKLLLATGGSVQPLEIPGADLPNLLYLRTLEDDERLHHAIEKARREGHPHERGGRGIVTVIGGGLLGVELAASLTQLGLGVDLVVSGAHPWSRFAGEITGRFITRYLETHGVRVHCGERAQRLEGDGRVQRVVLTSGRSIHCDFAVAAVGLRISKSLLAGTPIEAGRAILTDDHCRTSVEHIYAAGDCAAIFDPLFRKHRLLDHWHNAVVTGSLAGRNMAGADESYDVVNHFFSELFTLRMSAWGESRLVERRLMRGMPGPNLIGASFIEIGLDAQNRVAQVLAFGAAAQDRRMSQLVRSRLRIDGREEMLKDPATDLDQLLCL